MKCLYLRFIDREKHITFALTAIFEQFNENDWCNERILINLFQFAIFFIEIAFECIWTVKQKKNAFLEYKLYHSSHFNLRKWEYSTITTTTTKNFFLVTLQVNFSIAFLSSSFLLNLLKFDSKIFNLIRI